MLKALILMVILALPYKPANLATSILLAGENAGIVLTVEDKAAAYRYVQFLAEDGDCSNDWLTHMQPGLARVAQGYASLHGRCDQPLEAEWLDGAEEDDMPGYLVTDGDGLILICYHQLRWCTRER